MRDGESARPLPENHCVCMVRPSRDKDERSRQDDRQHDMNRSERPDDRREEEYNCEGADPAERP
jgi:hypothetical protein